MAVKMTRSDFIQRSLLTAGGLGTLGFSSFQSSKAGEIPEKLIREYVIAGHNDLDKLEKMLSDNPELMYTRYHWGNGDFEAAIEGAGHVGHREIAEYLIDRGARVTLYVLTMLGKEELVIPVLDEYPSLINASGPHGFTLLHHAKMGGEKSKGIYQYLQEKGLQTTKNDPMY
jgi:ankyrin repeat protein